MGTGPRGTRGRSLEGGVGVPSTGGNKASVRLIQIKILLYKIGRVDTGTAFEFVVWRAPSCTHSGADLVFNHTRRR